MWTVALRLSAQLDHHLDRCVLPGVGARGEKVCVGRRVVRRAGVTPEIELGVAQERDAGVAKDELSVARNNLREVVDPRVDQEALGAEDTRLRQGAEMGS